MSEVEIPDPETPTATLGDISDLSYGKSLPKESRNPEAKYPAVGSAGIVTFTDNELVAEPVLVVGRKGNVGSVQVFEAGCYPLDTTYFVRPRDGIDLHYLAWALRARNLVGLDSSTTLPSLRRQDLQAVKIPILSIDEQRRIVAQLEDHLGRLEATRNPLEDTRSELRNFRASALNKHFGDPSLYESDKGMLLGEALIPVAGKRKTQRGWSPQCESQPAIDGEWGVLKTTAVQMGWYEPGHNKALPSGLDPRPEVEVQVGDLLLLTTGPRNRCGIPALVEETPLNLMMSGKMIRIRSDRTRVLGEWLLLFLLSPHGQAELERLKVGSSDSSVSIGADVLLKIQIPELSLEEQSRIVAEMTSLAAAQRRVDELLEKVEIQLDTARASVLHRAFSGSEEEL